MLTTSRGSPSPVSGRSPVSPPPFLGLLQICLGVSCSTWPRRLASVTQHASGHVCTFYGCVIFHRLDRPHCARPPTHLWAFGAFPPFGCRESASTGVCSAPRLARTSGHKASLCLPFGGVAARFSKVTTGKLQTGIPHRRRVQTKFYRIGTNACKRKNRP